MSDENIRVTLAYPYTGEDGVAHRADSTISLPLEVGKNLIHSGRARVPDSKASTAKTTKKEG